MSIVPFRSNGPAADQNAPFRFIQIGPINMHIKQCSQKANALRVPGQPGLTDGDAADENSGVQWPQDSQQAGIQMQALRGPQQDPALVNVGMVVWQSGFVLSELLLRKPPFGMWPGVRVLDLGSGTGITGIALALAGAQVLLTDLPHILPLTQENVTANLRPAVHRAAVAEHSWGSDASPILQMCGGFPDVITAADCIYEVQFHEALMSTLKQCMGGHSVAYFSYRNRQRRELSFPDTAAAHGFAVETVPPEQLAEEYQTGGYCVLRLARIDAVPEGAGGVQTAEDTRLNLGLDSKDEEEEEELEHKPCSQS